jgi:hypothetical protein
MLAKKLCQGNLVELGMTRVSTDKRDRKKKFSLRKRGDAQN